MHHIITDDVEYAFPSHDIDMVFKLIKHLRDSDIAYTHHFEE